MVLKRLISAGLPHPSSLISVEDVRCGLPAPDPYLAGAQRLTLDPEHCAVFEDSPMGVKAARAAGVKVVIGIGQATVGHEVTISIPDLAGISFDGRSLVVSGDHLA